MRHFLPHEVANFSSDTSFRSIRYSTPDVTFSTTTARNLCLILLVCVVTLSSSLAQLPLATSRGDNSRSNANTDETLLTPSNVNKNSFGRLFSAPVDYVVMAQPLYVPNVSIFGQGTHNVVYVVTQADSVYAIDADTGAQLWNVSMLANVGAGATTASGKYLPCGVGPGFNQEGIVGTPVIDPNTNTMYLVAKSVLNGTVRHHLHALDITSGIEQPGSPVLIQATTVSNAGHKTVFNSLHQKNRPGLLLLNGVVYMGFGSNYCNDANSGWVLSYNAASLSPLAVFNTSPDVGLTSIWQGGSGLAADESGNIFVETAEAGNNNPYDIQYGAGQTYCNSVVKLAPDLTVEDYFTPWNVNLLNQEDFDLSSTGALVLPDQDGPYLHELVAGGKYGTVYVLDRDNLGKFSGGPADSQIIQEITLVVQNPNAYRDVLFGSPAYWNNTVYFAPDAAPLMAFPVSNGLLGTPAGTPIKTPATYNGSHSPSISANGSTNGILWVLSGGLNALDADVSKTPPLKLLYNSNQAAGGRDKLGTVGHFVTQTVANGKVFVAAETQITPTPIYALVAYGLFHAITVTGGSGQRAVAATALPNPLQIQVANPYTGQPDIGATVSFSDGCTKAGAVTCGSFNPASTVTDSNGNASTTYTVPQKAGNYAPTATLIVNGTAAGSTAAIATATAGSAVKVIALSGANQTNSAGFPVAKPIIAQIQDAYKNPVPGVTVSFSANKKGSSFNPSSTVTDVNGQAPSILILPTTPVPLAVTVTASCTSCTKGITFIEHSVASIATSISVSSGNNQSAAPSTQLPQALTVLVTDQFGNPFSGNSVTFSDNGAGGSFSNGTTVKTGADGRASRSYALPPSGTTVTINATATGVSSPAVFTETDVTSVATKIAVGGGNNQSAPAGTKLPQMLTVLVTDQFGNPLSGNSVTFSDNGAGGTFTNGNTIVTGANGTATLCYTVPKTATTITIHAIATGVSSPAVFTEASIAGAATYVVAVAGDGQTGPNGTQLPQALVVDVIDQYGNRVSGVGLAFSDGGSGGVFSNGNTVTGSDGTASQFYTLPAVGGETISITVTTTGVANGAAFTEYGQ